MDISEILRQIRDLACAAAEYHKTGKLYPKLGYWGAAPEYRQDNRSDIYCIGLALRSQLRDGHFSTSADPVLETILTRTLSPKPQGRYQCCEELVEDLDKALMLLHPFPEVPDNS